jgi:hypothetical protein
MADDQRDTRSSAGTKIIVAILALIAALGTAALSNLDKLFSQALSEASTFGAIIRGESDLYYTPPLPPAPPPTRSYTYVPPRSSPPPPYQ